MLTAALLRNCFPKCGDPEAWVLALTPALARFEINTPARLASFLAQIGHESGQFNRLEEGLIYQAARLCKVWPKRFPSEVAALSYANNKERLANFVYAKRLGNSDQASGDGYRYRGLGIILDSSVDRSLASICA